MIQFGRTLREAREAKGLSAGDVARETNLLARQVEALENEDFSHIAAPIYGRGFVKMYCQTVGLDPQPLVEAFMDIYTGKRQPAPLQKPAPQPAPEQPPEPAFPGFPAPTAETASQTPANGGAKPPLPPAFSLDAEVEPPHVEAPPPEPRDSLAQPRRMPKPASRYAAPASAPRRPHCASSILLGIPPAAWRGLLLLAAVGAIVWGVCVCAGKLYNAAMRDPQDLERKTATDAETPAAQGRTAAAAEEPAPPAMPPQDGAKRKPMKIDPLYID